MLSGFPGARNCPGKNHQILIKFSLQLHLKTKSAILIPFKANQGFLLHATRKIPSLDNPEILVKDQRLLNLDRIVQEVKETEEWEAVKMNILEIGLERGKELGMELGLSQGLAQGITQGIRQGQLKALVRSVELAMKNFSIDLPKACQGLEISVEEYEAAKEQLALWDQNPPVKK